MFLCANYESMWGNGSIPVQQKMERSGKLNVPPPLPWRKSCLCSLNMRLCVYQNCSEHFGNETNLLILLKIKQGLSLSSIRQPGRHIYWLFRLSDLTKYDFNWIHPLTTQISQPVKRNQNVTTGKRLFCCLTLILLTWRKW